jgi:predicted permease
MQQAIRDRVAGIPGVTSASLVNSLPMDGDGWHDPVFAEDHAYAEGQLPPLRGFKIVAPGLLETMGTPLVAGRDFTWTDLYDRRPVVMVSENLARELWGTAGAALGKRLRESSGSDWREVVGVVANTHDDGLDRPSPTLVYWPPLMKGFEANGMGRYLTLVVRSPRAGSPGFLAEIQRAVWSVNSNLPVASVRTLLAIYERSMARTSFTLVMLAIAGGMALVLGVVGIYGVIAYSVSQRTREIGIRMALGSSRRELTAMFVRHGLVLALVGAACGLLAAAGLSRLLASLLFGVGPADTVTYATVASGLVAAAVLASYLPARRATRVDPVEALRAE